MEIDLCDKTLSQLVLLVLPMMVIVAHSFRKGSLRSESRIWLKTSSSCVLAVVVLWIVSYVNFGLNWVFHRFDSVLYMVGWPFIGVFIAMAGFIVGCISTLGERWKLCIANALGLLLCVTSGVAPN
jgi:hypothetical protein